MASFAMYTPLITRDRSSGRIHRRIPLGRQILVDERCNLDAAGGYDVVPNGEMGLTDTDAALLCQNCFPAPEDDPVEETLDSV